MKTWDFLAAERAFLSLSGEDFPGGATPERQHGAASEPFCYIRQAEVTEVHQ